ncbi:MAG: class A beta-lactamase-related serine hydrolase [Actinomycetota bacterium]|nr:class A beta-lactamase-related serine hydrolase [Actinomycetota bacterium]
MGSARPGMRKLTEPRLRPRLAVAAAVTALALLAGPVSSSASTEAVAAAKGGESVERFPWDSRVREAKQYAQGRAGSVSFAVVDEFGRIHSFRRGQRYSSASLVKAMLLVAYLRKGDVRNRGLHRSELALLGPMIRVSDNNAASAIHARVGSAGLNRLARRSGMKRFVPNPVWGGCRLTARDQAEFFFRIRRLLPERHRSYALGLLRNIAPGQRWGVPQGRPKGWRAHFKGGWYPDGDGWRVHQGALLRRGDRELGLAVLTRGGPSLGYGAATISGVTGRLLRGYERFGPPGGGTGKGTGARAEAMHSYSSKR